jgi:hypothetical protein
MEIKKFKNKTKQSRYSSMNKSRTMRWAGHAAHMGKERIQELVVKSEGKKHGMAPK